MIISMCGLFVCLFACFFDFGHVEDETELRGIRLPGKQLRGGYCHGPDKRLRTFLN